MNGRSMVLNKMCFPALLTALAKPLPRMLCCLAFYCREFDSLRVSALILDEFTSISQLMFSRGQLAFHSELLEIRSL